MSPFRSLWSKRSSKSSRSSTSQRAVARRAMRVEALEDRCLLTASSDLDLLAAGAATAKSVSPKLDSTLNDLAVQYANYAASVPQVDAAAFAASYDSVTKGSGGGVVIEGDSVTINAVAAGSVSVLRDDLHRMGATITATFGNQLSADIPVSCLSSLDTLGSLQTARFDQRIMRVGTYYTQGGTAMGLQNYDQFTTLIGYDATTGVRQMIGVISDSYNYLGGAGTGIAAGDLPGAGNPNGYTQTVLLPVGDGGVIAGRAPLDEGRAMLEIIHDLAPGAQLAFAPAGASETSMAQAIVALRNLGCTVIVDDVGFLGEPYFQDGPIAQAVDTVVQSGCAYFSAAGNEARQSYESAWRPGGSYTAFSFTRAPTASSTLAFYGGRAHDFDPGPGVSDFQLFQMAQNQSVTVIMQWDQPFAQNGNAGSQNDIDIYVLDAANQLVAGSTDLNVGGSPLEGFTFTAPAAGTYRMMITTYSGANPGYVKYMWYPNTSGATLNNLAYATNSGTAVGHSNSEFGVSVGAAYYATPNILESFSSAGGVPILFTDAGARLSSPELRNTVDFVSPDGVSTSVSTNFRPFYGTSAAAPHLAALAVLLKQLNPAATPAQIYQAMQNASQDMLTSGYDNDSGWGFVRGDTALLNWSGGALPLAFRGTTGNDTMTIKADGAGNTQFFFGTVTPTTAPAFSFPTILTTSISVDGRGGTDTVIVDSANGNPIPSGGINFNGSASPTANLQVNNGIFSTIDNTFLTARSGTITLLGLAVGSGGVISYNNLTSVQINPTSSQAMRFFMRTDVVNPDIVLGNDATAQNDLSQISGSTFQNTIFKYPSLYTYIKLSELGDTLATADIDTNYAASGSTSAAGTFAPVTIVGGAGTDTFNINTARKSGNATYNGLAVYGQGGSDVFNITNPPQLTTPTTLSGGDDTDVFNMTFPTTGTVGAALSINGDLPAVNPLSRDVFNITDVATIARVMTFTAIAPASSGAMTIGGLGNTISVAGLETLNYTGFSDLNDRVTINSVNDIVNFDKINVYPRGLNAVDVSFNRGVSGGARTPDMRFTGLDATTSTSAPGFLVNSSSNVPSGSPVNGDMLVYSGDHPTDFPNVTPAYSGYLARANTINVNYRNIARVVYGPTAMAAVDSVPSGGFISEGQSITLNAAGTAIDTTALTVPGGTTLESYQWDLNLDGNYDFITPTPQLTLNWATIKAYGLNDGTPGGYGYSVGLRATDSNGGFNDITTPLTMYNTPPTLGFTGGTTAGEGTPFSLNLSSFDPGADTITQWDINWGDGSPPQVVAGNPSAVSHAFPAGANVYNVTATATDEDGTYTAYTTGGGASKPVGVYVVPATINSLVGPINAVPGLTLTYTGLFTDPAGTHTAIWDWGDGTPTSNGVVTDGVGAGNVVQNHVYTVKGSYTLKLTLNEVGSAPITRTLSVVVGDAALVADPLNPALTSLLVAGTTGNDSILLTAGAAGSIDVAFNNRFMGNFSPTGHVFVLGNAGNDSIVVGNMIGHSIFIDGGEGDDQLTGGIGRTIIIGGGGQDRLTASTADTLLIAGRADIQTDVAARNAIIAEWDSGSTYADRMAHILGELGGGQNGSTYLTAATVYDDAARDTVIGNNGMDGFYAHTSGGITDILLNRRSDERLISI